MPVGCVILLALVGMAMRAEAQVHSQRLLARLWSPPSYASAAPSKVTSAPILELTVSPGPDATVIVLAVTNDAGERPDVLGFHINREEFTGEWDGCSNFTRVTDDFLPRSFGNSSYSFRVEGDALEAGRAYWYRLEGYPPLENGPHWSFGFDIAKSWAIVTMGQALIAVNTRVQEIPGGLELLPCASACTSFLWHVGSAPSEIVNSGSWRLFGTARPRADEFRFEWVVDSALPDDCTPWAVVPSAWGTVKSLFR